MKHLKPVLIAAGMAAGIALVALPARAEGLYVGGALGAPHFGGDAINGVPGNGTGVSGKLFGGWQFSPNFALEAGLADLGRVDNGFGKVRSHGGYLDAVGLLPLGDEWTLLGSLGVARVQANTDRGDATGTGLKLGLGAQYALSSHLALRGEWERYRPSVFGVRPNIDQYTVGLSYGF
ncbi:MAG: porin family protein [Burkholderiales bacterium]|nr:porin family protein [Burkholderiales bacterium]